MWICGQLVTVCEYYLFIYRELLYLILKSCMVICVICSLYFVSNLFDRQTFKYGDQNEKVNGSVNINLIQ